MRLSAEVGARELGLRNEEAHEDLFPGAAVTPLALRPPASRPAVQGRRRRFLRRARRPSADPNAIRPNSVRLEANRLSTSEPRFPPACPLGPAQSSTPTSKVRHCTQILLRSVARRLERREDWLVPGLSRSVWLAILDLRVDPGSAAEAGAPDRLRFGRPRHPVRTAAAP